MPVEVKKLKLDLQNYRTVAQVNETDATAAMISLKPGWFWALTESLLEDGYHPTENIIVLKEGRTLRVKEGNRRIAAMKIISGQLNDDAILSLMPSHLLTLVNELPKKWKAVNKTVPCVVYESKEKDTVSRIVSLMHAKGEKAGRDKWNPVARARYSRNELGKNEPALDLLEQFLVKGKTVSGRQAEQWGGDYPLSILDEAIKKVAERCGCDSAKNLAEKYPRVKFRLALENMLRDIGLGELTFPDMRGEPEFGAAKYEFPELPEEEVTTGKTTKKKKSTKKKTAKKKTKKSSKKADAKPMDDQRSVKAVLRDFMPKGKNREKVATLLEEARLLSIKKNPLAFCFVLRSMFEISAKAYCEDHKGTTNAPKLTKSGGKPKTLLEVLRGITNHITGDKRDVEKTKILHGALTVLAQPENILSVTSMNQLVH